MLYWNTDNNGFGKHPLYCVLEKYMNGKAKFVIYVKHFTGEFVRYFELCNIVLNINVTIGNQ